MHKARFAVHMVTHEFIDSFYSKTQSDEIILY